VPIEARWFRDRLERLTAQRMLESSVSSTGRCVSYVEGQRYAEFRPGDRLAGYGLAGLIGAGAAGVALKTGLFQKFWKLIVVAGIGLVGIVRKFFYSVFGGRQNPAVTDAGDSQGDSRA
jgi:uncharacterized membrane-anchored protein